MKKVPKVKRSSVVKNEVEVGTTHITPANGNIFLDLGFKPEEAEALLKESDLRISKMGFKDKEI